MPPLPADSIHARACKLKCEKILTRPSPLHISPSPFIAFYGGDFVKATNFIVTERRLSSEQFPDLSLIRRAVTLWLRNALYRRL